MTDTQPSNFSVVIQRRRLETKSSSLKTEMNGQQTSDNLDAERVCVDGLLQEGFRDSPSTKSVASQSYLPSSNFYLATSVRMESPFAYRLGTNYVPSDEEIERIQLDLVSHREQLARLDARIRELSEQRDKFKAYIDAHKALISHARRLPGDILEAIFLACLPTSRNAVMSTQEAPLLLCRIFSAWRIAALSMPRLWASLHVPVDFVLAKKSRPAAVEQWLQRAAACPISLSVWETWREPTDSDSAISALAKRLVAYSAGWRHIELTNMSVEIAQALAESFELPQCLESFTVVGNVLPLSAVKFLDGPSLRSVSLQSEGDLRVVLTLSVAWHQLTHLSLKSFNGREDALSLGDTIVLLGRCSRLVSFCVTLGNTQLPLESSCAALPFLVSLRVDGYWHLPSASLKYILDCVAMPQLRLLHAPTVDTEHEGGVFPLLSMVGKMPFLGDLTFNLASLTPQSLLETLQGFPTITHLSANTQVVTWGTQPPSCGTTTLLEVLTDTSICPQMHGLNIANSSDLSKTTLDAFLQARVKMESAGRLRRLIITFQRADPWSPFNIPDLSLTETQAYLAQGLDISLIPIGDPGISIPGPRTGLPPDKL
ncbi:hypothetical protein R3P38DRAFT_3370806 [Favolaschia claudopus]|uniref:F-box domain-containing protein n=1 Tax=Favolaschia claudopus TaxID=2862362 RepID=A0AAW0A0G9_9AGAR